jgi:hypothetical protein
MSRIRAWSEGTLEAEVASILVAMRATEPRMSGAMAPDAASRSPSSDPRKGRHAVNLMETLLGRRRNKCRTRYGNRFAGSPERARGKCLKGMEKWWRRGWDSNPRAGITRPSDFESAPL